MFREASRCFNFDEKTDIPSDHLVHNHSLGSRSLLPICFPGSVMKLTKATVARLSLAPGKVDQIIFDEDMPGFGIRLRGGGKYTWIVQYRVGAKQRRVTLGDLRKLDAEQARTAARNRLAQVTLGGDPQAEKANTRAQAAFSLGTVSDTFLAVKKSTLRPKSFDETERYLLKYWCQTASNFGSDAILVQSDFRRERQSAELEANRSWPAHTSAV
jgi:hypothetical protein